MRKILAFLSLLIAAPAWATMVCGVNISGTSTPACWSVNATTSLVEVRPRDSADAKQQFIVTPDGRVRSAVDGRCIGVRSATVTNPVEAPTARACTSTLVSGDRWVFKKSAGAASHQIQSFLGSLLAGATSNAPAAGSSVTMWTADGSAAQDWKFVDFPVPLRATDTTVPTMRIQVGFLKYDAATIPKTTEMDCTVPLGRYCLVPGTQRYARTLIAAPGTEATEIAAVQFQAPAVTVATAAAISGSATEGQTLTLTAATFSNYTGSVVTQLLRGSTVIATGVAPYTITATDVGQVLTLRSTAGAVTSQASTSTVVAAGGGGGGTSPNTNTVAFFSTNHPAGIDPDTNPHWGPYPTLTVNGLNCVNNIWGFVGTTASARMSLGCQSGSNGGVDWRMAITSPQDSGKEVVGYPEIILGKTPSGTAATSDTRFPRALANITSATISYQSASGSLTRGQITTDIYITTVLGCGNTSCRDTEIMVQAMNFGGYNTPAPWSPCGANRTAGNTGDGPNPNATTYCDVNIGGTIYDIYNYAPGTWGEVWRLVKVFPKVLPKTGGGSFNIKAILDALVARNVFPSNRYVGALEFGIEPIVTNSAISGDVTIRGIRLDATVN